MNFGLLLPEFLTLGLAFLVFTADFFLPEHQKNRLALVSVLGLIGVLCLTPLVLPSIDEELFGGIIKIDRYAVLFKMVFLATGVLIIVASTDFVRTRLSHPGEYYGLIIISVLAMMLMASSGELLTAYLSLELLSFTLYILSGFSKDHPKSNEASIKYILLGAFSSALLLYGMVLLYGALGTTHFSQIGVNLGQAEGATPRIMVGLALLATGLGFKMTIFPFHMWAPDVYEGAPIPITAYIAVGSKAAVFVLLMRLFAEGFLPIADQWTVVAAILSAATMVVGNLLAISQTNLKRLLAYSSIGQAGYLLMGIAAISILGYNGALFHLLGYIATSLVAFIAIISFYNNSGRDEIKDLAGLSKTSPYLAMSITIALFSFSGLPFFAGFTTKFYLFSSVATQGLLWLSGIAMIASLVSLYYYLKIIRTMYIEPTGNDVTVITPKSTLIALSFLIGVVIVIGVYPSVITTPIEQATIPLFGSTGTR